jgi:hypothetical protein
MRGDALAAVEDLDGGRGQACVDVVVDERVGDRVVVAVELDVIVDADAGADLPVAVDEGLRGERAQRGVIQPLEELAAAGAVEPHRPRVEIREEFGDPGIERREREEGLVAEAARIHRSATWTATSIFALSRGFAGRAGRMTVP